MRLLTILISSILKQNSCAKTFLPNPMLRPRLIAFSIFCLALLSACASISPIPKEPKGNYSQALREHLYDMETWRLEGRLAITAPKDSWSASIEWEHQPASEKIRLSGPLGQGAVVIELAGGMVKIDRGGGNVQTSKEPEQFINQQLGLFVPIQSLRFWAVGLPRSGQSFQETTDGFVQSGWLVAYKECRRRAPNPCRTK